MSELIQSLTAAHAALLTSAAGASNSAALLSTARKVEVTLVGELGALDEEGRGRLLGHVMNSGSLKALKVIPQAARMGRFPHGRGAPNPAFILAQSPAFIREAQKRGLEIDDSMRVDLFKTIAADPGISNRKMLEA